MTPLTVQDATRHNYHELAGCSDYSTIRASMRQMMTKPCAQSSETTANYTIALPAPRATCHKSSVKGGEADNNLSCDSSVFSCQQTQDCVIEVLLGSWVVQLKTSQNGETLTRGNPRAVHNLREYLMTDESDGERQKATAMEDNVDDLRWQVYPTSPLLTRQCHVVEYNLDTKLTLTQN